MYIHVYLKNLKKMKHEVSINTDFDYQKYEIFLNV